MAALETARAPWVHGICDSMLRKVVLLDFHWPRGDVAATRPFMTKDGRIEDVATRRKVDILWLPREFEAMLAILKVHKPDWQLTLDLALFYKQGFKKTKMREGGLRLVSMVLYEFQVKELLKTMLDCRLAGKLVKPNLTEELKGGQFWEKVK
jgi:hypothetical protein